ncbi:L-fucose:H+ symporter permease [Mucilaginibacter polytrichastri]|uniref:L-fucose-proton symporter n=1 Tax=Mucilaginibacter polytrichastri TaxID=1302689 RepID=A0A1Q5ZX27_9SPHI|nr:L-fucose:H+ symporter permease [Mucilaginibacter polytrichastri]OKS86310.1 L-fucose-proton symporter [Mucilaginibacter polytrichastri]SFT16818.1 MFS transporter, FHS family, L-fucose permease [Mucilaginibacter polytrichastri]
MPRKTLLFPLILITSLFFLWAFLHNINPILIPHLKKACQLNDTQSSFIDLSVYLAYFIIAIPAGLFMHKYGYKKGIIIGLVLYAAGAFMFIPAAAGRNYLFFLAGLFVIASGATFLEAVANPYMAALGSKETAAQRLNFAQSFNGLGSFIAPIIGGKFILSGIEHNAAKLKSMSAFQLNSYLQAEANTVKIPYLIIGMVVVVLILFFLFTKIPDVNADEEASQHSPGTDFSIKVLRHSHLRWSIIAQFFYVGAQVGVGSFFIRYAKYVAAVDEKTAAFLWGAVAMVGFMLGRFIGTFLMRYIKPATLLGIYAAINILLIIVALNTTGHIALYAIVMVPFFMSIMYPTIFALGISGLGHETKIAASFLVMSIIGGAFAPLAMGFISDKTGSIQIAYIVPLICFSMVLYYALKGHRIKIQPIVSI